MQNIRIGIAGVGNCASALVLGIHYYRNKSADDAIGLMHWSIGGYTPGDIDVVAAIDIDQRKVDRSLAEAIFAAPNCTRVFFESVPDTGVRVQMGCILDGIADHMAEYDDQQRFIAADRPEHDKKQIVEILKESGVQILLNYMPVGSEQASARARLLMKSS